MECYLWSHGYTVKPAPYLLHKQTNELNKKQGNHELKEEQHKFDWMRMGQEIEAGECQIQKKN